MAKYIYTYYGTAQKKRSSIQPYRYNSFELMKVRLIDVDMRKSADQIMELPMQIEIHIGSVKYLLAYGVSYPGGRLAALCLETGEEYYSLSNEMEAIDI